ncbi:MAG: type I secretion system permease/ATPase, partial [Comamonas sp.]
ARRPVRGAGARRGDGAVAQALGALRRAFGTVGVFSAVVNLLMLVPAVYMLQVYDRVLPSRNGATLLMLTLMMLGLYAFLALLDYARARLAIRLGSQLDMALNTRVFGATFETNLRGGALPASQPLGDLATLRQFLTGQTLFAFFDAPWFPVYLAVIFLFHPWLGLLALAGALLLLALSWLNERLSGPPLAEAGRTAIESGRQATASLRNAEAIAAMGMLATLRRRWLALHLRFLGAQQHASEQAAGVAAATRFVRLSLQSLVLGAGALLAIEGEITPGMMIAASILMSRVLAPIEQVIAVWKQWKTARQAWQRLDLLLAAGGQSAPGMALPRPLGRLAAENVSAAAPGPAGKPGRTVLARLNFALAPGRTLAVLGASGTGKSTLARLLVGVAAPQSGRVRLDGADLHAWNKDELGPALGYLPQDVALFAGSVAANIARGGEPDAAQVVAAARAAGVHDMVLQLPQGYDTELGENGAGLSGGQRQRVGLARALYGEPALVVLDEPDAHLDEAGQAALARAIQGLKARGATVVVITHRHGLLGLADDLLLLRPGQPAAFGPRDAMLKTLREQAGKGAGMSAPLAAAPTSLTRPGAVNNAGTGTAA